MKHQINMNNQPRFSKGITRRDLLKTSGVAAAAGLTGCSRSADKQGDRISVPTYESIGATPVINCMGTMTHLGGSLMPPEVVAAMEEAAKQYIPMRELMDCVGKRLAELTGAEWGCVTSGAAAGMFASTCACVAGSDREKREKLPDTSGMKNECLVSKAHRTPFDRAIRMVGVKMVEAETIEEMEADINDKTVMIFVLGEISPPGHPAGGAIPTEDIMKLGNKHGIPILVDAAAERPDVPERYITMGADLVTYSGGKCLMGPNDTGLLLGRKDLVQAAFSNISPHMSLGRPMKVSKEAIMGLLTAMELWVNGRDHNAEWKEWERRLTYISDIITQVPSVKTEIIPPGRLCNYAPSMTITWDQNAVKISADDLRDTLRNGTPKIALAYRKGDEFRSRGEWVSVQPYMMQPGEDVIVAQVLHDTFLKVT